MFEVFSRDLSSSTRSVNIWPNICSITDRPTLTKTSLVNTMDQQYHVDRIKKGDASVIITS